MPYLVFTTVINTWDNISIMIQKIAIKLVPYVEIKLEGK
jgi:hypothetical protein